jgi:hypothetical protein
MQIIAEARRYNIITAKKPANTLYFHLILDTRVNTRGSAKDRETYALGLFPMENRKQATMRAASIYWVL